MPEYRVVTYDETTFAEPKIIHGSSRMDLDVALDVAETMARRFPDDIVWVERRPKQPEWRPL